jgi:hypothetical protein
VTQVIHLPTLDILTDHFQVVAEGDLVAYQCTWQGTHLGPWRGIAPTGKQVEWRATCFRRVVDGKVVAGWGTYDWLSVLAVVAAVALASYPPTLVGRDRLAEANGTMAATGQVASVAGASLASGLGG